MMNIAQSADKNKSLIKIIRHRDTAPSDFESRRNVLFNSGRKLTDAQRRALEMSLASGLISPQKAEADYGLSKAYVYKLKSAADPVVQHLEDSGCIWLRIDQNVIDRIVVALSTYCQASISSIRLFLKICFHVSASTGKISTILSDYAERARKINSSVDLSGIKAIGLDEIYQEEQPVLTGVCLDTTYCLIMEPEQDRKAQTWVNVLNSRKTSGLNPDLTISDSCGSILSAVPEAFPHATVQMDVFHALMNLGKEVLKVPRRAMSDLQGFFQLEDRVKSHKARMKTIEEYIAAKDKIDAALERSDRYEILMNWIRELLGFPGYSIEETMSLINAALDDMADMTTPQTKLYKAISTFREDLPKALKYLKLMFQHVDEAADHNGFPRMTFRQLYLLRRYRCCSDFNSRWDDLWKESGCSDEEFCRMDDAIKKLISGTKRASSLIENLNSRLRVFMNAKREVSEPYFPLIQLYINTKVYNRSTRSFRRGKSPMEMVTGIKKSLMEYLGIADPTIVSSI